MHINVAASAHAGERAREWIGGGERGAGGEERGSASARVREPERAGEGRGREEVRQGEKELFVTGAIKHTRMSVVLSYRS